MFDKEQDRIFLTILKENVGPHLSIREISANLEDAAFGDEVVKACIEIFPKPE
jgi:hypothetical protein